MTDKVEVSLDWWKDSPQESVQAFMLLDMARPCTVDSDPQEVGRVLAAISRISYEEMAAMGDWGMESVAQEADRLAALLPADIFAVAG